jgi:beta-glucosidase
MVPQLLRLLAITLMLVVIVNGQLNCLNPTYRGNPWCNSSLPASSRARLLLQAMNLTEMDQLLYGVNGPYTGNTLPNKRLGIPTLNMNDGPQGFRANTAGTTTQFPCSLCVAASFDVDTAYNWGRAMGEEFVAKGANIQLGPALNVERVPLDGRNFEYLSGEDPMLGYWLTYSVVKAIQSTGVMANAKHYINNNQEINRTTISANLDERTRMEIYAQPFWGAVDAGVLSVMCSYNRINDTYACENDLTLNQELKGYMNFQGFVMSDWGATHSTVAAANNGLDQEMPDDLFYGSPLRKAVEAGTVSQAAFQDHAYRILYAMFAIGLFDRQPVGNPNAVVTSPAHSLIARQVAINGTVVLKKTYLPLNHRQVSKIALFGTAAGSQPVTGGHGSGEVTPPYVITPLLGLENFFAARHDDVEILYYDGDDPQEAVQIATMADISISVLATNSGEGDDRPNLDLPANEILITQAVAAVSKTIALVIAPGPVLLPFDEVVSDIVLMFMPGQEEGNAFADVIFGAVNPSGRLPVTIPVENNQVGFVPLQYPGVANEEYYTEKLEIGYRWYTANNAQPLYPFGFGLSYTTFSFSNLVITGRQVQFTVTNTGSLAGVAVPQLYVGYPAAAGEPPLQLRHFSKVGLAPKGSQVVTYTLSDRDLSIWNVQQHQMQVFPGDFTILVGSSSAEIALKGVMSVSA